MGVLFGTFKITDEFDLWEGVALVRAEVEVSRTWLLGYIDEVSQTTADRLGRSRGTDFNSRMDTLCDTISLADSSLFRHRMDLPQGLPKRWLYYAFKR